MHERWIIVITNNIIGANANVGENAVDADIGKHFLEALHAKRCCMCLQTIYQYVFVLYMLFSM